MDEPRSEQPTPRTLADARRRGQIAVSPALIAGAAALAACAVLSWSGTALLIAVEQLTRAALHAIALAPGRSALATLAQPLRELGLASLPLLLAPCAAAVLAGLVQVGPLFASRALRPDLGRLDPRSRSRALWSGDRMLEVSYSTLTACALVALFAWWLTVHASALLSLSRSDPARALSVLARLGVDIVLRMGVAVVLFGTIDLALRRVRARRALRMSRRELSAELRESYGSPEHRARRERLQREARDAAELGALQSASLLLIDGAGRAIALALRDHSPRVLAKAQGVLALKMRAAAAQAGVPVRDHTRLVSALFRCELGDVVHSDHYAELAELFVESGAA
jgi:flagellar biosynthetic protein FlhB